MIITCRKCQHQKPRSTQIGNICRDCYCKYSKEYYATNKTKQSAQKKERYVLLRQDKEFVDRERARGREYWRNLRHEAIMAYGGYKCSCCGETEPRFLSIDHINNNGAEHRRSLGYKENGKGASGNTMKWLKDNKYPEGFQVLCMNCNHGKAMNHGTCPHKEKDLMKNLVKSVDTLSLGKIQDNTEPSHRNVEGVTTIPSGSTLKRVEAPEVPMWTMI